MSELFRCDGCGRTFGDDATLTKVSIDRRICPATRRAHETLHYCPACTEELDRRLERATTQVME